MFFNCIINEETPLRYFVVAKILIFRGLKDTSLQCLDHSEILMPFKDKSKLFQ